MPKLDNLSTNSSGLIINDINKGIELILKVSNKAKIIKPIINKLILIRDFFFKYSF